MTTRATTKGEFTGRHMLFIMLAFFGVIISVNVTMAVFAGKSWSGLLVKNSYVASQHFNEHFARARAQAALGWEAKLEIAGGKLRYRLTDRSGTAVRLDGVTASFKRPVSTADDAEFVLTPGADGAFEADAALGDGVWIAEIYSAAGLDQPYRDVRRVVLARGELR